MRGMVARDRQLFAVVVAPMLWEGRGIGSIYVMRQPPEPFADKEIDACSRPSPTRR